MENLLEEIEKWSQKYDINFQFWSGNNTFYIEKNDVDLHSEGGFQKPKECVVRCLNYLYIINKTPKNKRIC